MEENKFKYLAVRDIYFKILYDAYLIYTTWFNHCHLHF